MKRFLYYFISFIIIGFVFYGGIIWQYQIETAAKMKFNMLPLALFTVGFAVLIGALFRLPTFIHQLIAHKSLSFDWPKFLAICLPSFFILLLYMLAILGKVIAPYIMLISDKTLPTVVGVVFGYCLLACFKKCPADVG